MNISQRNDFAKAFDWAVVRLATYFPASASNSRLLFASVSLLTPDRPRPRTSEGVETFKLGKGKGGKIFFRRIVLSADDAIAWYRRVGANGIQTPIPTLAEEVEEIDGIALSPTSFEDDLQWPFLGVPLSTDLFYNAVGPGDPAPFCGAGAPRIHRRFGDNAGFEAVLADELAVGFLKRRLHVDLSSYSEYLGSIALVVPDPVLRRVQHFLVPSESADGPERLIYRLLPRPGQSLDGLQLTILERRLNVLVRIETFDVPADGLVTIESALPFDQTGYAISHKVQGLIAYQQPVPFIRMVKASVGIASRKVSVQFPRNESPRSPADGYEVTEYADGLPMSIGTEPRNSLVTVVTAEQRRIRKAAAKQYKQTWFDTGQRDIAVAFLRGQLARARQFVMVADPYFGALQIYQFLQAIPRTHIDFTILTSRLAFESHYDERSNEADPEAQDAPRVLTEVERLNSFAASLDSLRSRGMKSVNALVLSGKTPPLHDRFLVIDGEVLFLGSSLNALGERASLILSLPDSEPVFSKLWAMAGLAVPFEAYAAQRFESSPPPSGSR